MKVSFYNIGCKVNFAEISQIQEQFKDFGYEIVHFGDRADAVFIHTCTVTNQADADSRKFIRRAVRDNPYSYIGVMGCYSQLSSDKLSIIEGVDAIFGNEEKFHILELVPSFTKNSQTEIFIDKLESAEFHSACSVDNEVHTRIALKIQDGCDYFCNYCAVPYSRGRSRSMDFNQVIDKVAELADTGVKEIVLSGINLGDYRNSGKIFEDLIYEIDKLNINTRLRISSIEPNLLTEKILDIIASSKVFCHHFHIPLQSGSDTVLSMMKRRYDTIYFRKLIGMINTKIPNSCIGIDIINGFPGETQEEFTKTYNFINSLDISYLHVFSYSDRDIAAASKFKDKVSKSDIKLRTAQLRELSEAKRIKYYKNNINTVHRFIPERYYPDKGYIDGWTDNYIRVNIKAEAPLEKDFYNIKLIELKGDAILSDLI